MNQRRTAVAAWGLAGLFVVLFGAILWMDARIYAIYFPQLGSLAWLGLHGIWLGPFVVFAVVGAVIASRRARNPIGWVMLASAYASGIGEAMRWYAALAIGNSPIDPPPVALWLKPFATPITIAGIILGLVIIPLLFPDGRPLSARWRSALWIAAAVPTLLLIFGILSPRLSHSVDFPGRDPVQLYDVANPLSPASLQDLAAAVPEGPIMILLPVLILAAGVAVVTRFRRSVGVERRQMKWFVYAAGLVGVAAAMMTLVSNIGPTRFDVAVQGGLLVAGLSAYPVAVGVAVLRYRLYEIDRLISRTVAYGLIVAVLGGVYVIGVVGLGELVAGLTGQQDSDLAVAVSVLAVVAAFGPVRSRVRIAVDRRFNRTGYQARRAVETFTSDVRDEVDLDVIRARTAETVAAAVEPTHVSVWLADSGETEA